MDADDAKTPGDGFVGPRRFVRGASTDFARYVQAARNYPAAVGPELREGLYRKPFGVQTQRGSLSYLSLATCQVLNVLDALNLPPGAVVIDAGAGSGWVSEILLGVGYIVRAVEPSPAMIEAARERIAMFERKYHIPVLDRVTFIASTLEDLPPPAPGDARADAVFFWEAFHHVIDETRAAKAAYDQLRDGGRIAICGESRWLPGNAEQAESWTAEMARYGTLESPFTREYLRHVLERAGFIDVTFHHAVNRLVPVADEARTARELAGHGSAEYQNVVIARRWSGPAIGEHPDLTRAEITVLEVSRPEPAVVLVTVRLRNVGATMWPDGAGVPGWVAIALWATDSAGAAVEARNRERLPRWVLPGEACDVACRFVLADGETPLRVALVSNDRFWFRESAAVPPAA